MLEFIDHKEDDLKNSVFCNVNPKNGGKTLSKEYKEAMENGKPQKMARHFASLKDEITVFTCFDIYDKLLESDNIKNKEKRTWLSYNRKDLNKRKDLRYFEGEIGKAKIKVYEIVHPSVSSKITKKE